MTAQHGDQPVSMGTTPEQTNGAAWAAYLAAAIGAFAAGLIVMLNEVGLFSAPVIYGPAGGVSGRTTLAVIVWLVAWLILHLRWKSREVEPARLMTAMWILIVLGILGTFPPVWNVFG